MKSIALSCFGLFFVSFFIIAPDAGRYGIGIQRHSMIENQSHKNKLTAYVDTTVVELKTDGIELSYSMTEIHAKAGDILLIQYINESDMSHNIVLVREEEDIRPVGVAALQAIANDWIPENEMDRIIAYSGLAYPGDTVEFAFKVPPPGTYPYICTYSAHWTQMQGRLISTE
ncbi:plastocyanin/azurin family copper-binding protein [Pleomorphovibrio marinus]|uniref:plastocyanin/azurin family copper-binding protein n=1 Tax=Pleomorphovibrio marinus TaxID=2164132 RepID=UPI000E0BE9EB|nr:plastocyanin/azurin family copper-binding protein [Pleomorphovibrio marinus]